MISIFQSSRSAPAPVSKDGARALGLLSQALKLNLIRAKGLNYVELAASLDALAYAVEKAEGEAAVLESSSHTCGAVQHYFEQLGQSIDAVGFDLATSIRALATLLHTDSGNQEEFLGKMEEIRDNFQAGHTLDDVHVLRQHLDSCLTSLRSELFQARQNHQASQAAMLDHMSHLHRSISTLRAKVPPKHTTGPALSILRIRRLKAVRDRCGDTVAQRMLDYVIQILLVRWPAAYDITPYGEECLVVIDSQNLDLDFHRAALRKLSGEKNVFNTQHDGHEIILPLALDWTVIRAPAEGDMDEFIRNFLDGMAQKDNQAASLDHALGLQPNAVS
jgi:hypothetical protein